MPPPWVKLKAVLSRSSQWIQIEPERTYQEVTVRMWGKGVVQRREVLGAEIASSRRLRVQAGQFIMSKIDARHGAFGLIPDALDGAVVTNDFPVFDVNHDVILPSYVAWLSKTRRFIELCKTSSEGSTNRMRLTESKFLESEIQLPSIDEQRQIVTSLENVVAKLELTNDLREQIDSDSQALLLGAFKNICIGAPRRTIREVAPLERRPISIESSLQYPEIGARSFGKGTFRKPILKGSDLTWQKLFQVESGDLLLSNIKAWEGAIAVVQPADNGRFVSHRYLTCVPIEGLAVASFLCFYLLTQEGLGQVQVASPGSADRNRTLGMDDLQRIEVPVPDYASQLWFDRLTKKVREVTECRQDRDRHLEALLPTLVEDAFKDRI